MDLFDSMSPDQAQALTLFGLGLMRHNAAGGLQAATTLLAGAPDRELERQFKRAQIGNYQSEVDTRAAALKQKQALQDAMSTLFGQGGAAPAQPAAPGQLGSGSFGMVAPPAGQPDIPPAQQVLSRIARMSEDDIGRIHALGGPDLTNLWKTVKEGFERKPGSFYDDTQGRRQYIADPKTGIDYQGGRITGIPGYTDFLTQQTLAQEAPKTLLSSAATMNLRDNGDNTKSPVNALMENPTLQGVLERVLGVRQAPPRAPNAGVAPPQRPGAANPPPGSGIVPPESESDRLATLQGALAQNQALLKTSLNDADRERVTRDIGDIQREMGLMGTAGGVPRYGMTTEQQNAAAAAKVKAEEDAKAAAARDADRAKKGVSAGDTLLNIGMARKLLQQSPTHSGAGAAVDSVASFFGKSTNSADVASQLDTLGGWMTANVPRMEGPQSNYDVQQYRTMAALVGDRTKPVSQRLKALDTLEQLSHKYAPLNPSQGGATGSWEGFTIKRLP